MKVHAAAGLFLFVVAAAASTSAADLRFEVRAAPDLVTTNAPGRLFVILASTNSPEPRFTISRPGRDAPITLACDAPGPGRTNVLDASAFTFPITNLAALPPGDYFIQALFDNNPDLRFPNAPGNLYSLPRTCRLDPAGSEPVELELNRQVLPEQVPPDTDRVKFVKLESKLLSAFHHRPMYLRAGIVLPRDYAREPDRQYPLWVRVGGLNTRYTVVSRLLDDRGEFRRTWLTNGTPQFVLLQLDGAGPYGDPYYVNSANNGPYGDALLTELIPYVEQRFRVRRDGRARVLSGVSTGGWVALALQIFYPDEFNGVWASCPDPVDFRAFEQINLYADTNAYVDAQGRERPSERNLKGQVTLTTRREVGVENLLGRGNSYTRSGEQWGAWNAVYGARDAQGLPTPVWDPHTGIIDSAAVEHWKAYDLRLVLETNWKQLGPKLRGKLHIASGEADQFYLNNAVHLLQQFLSRADPAFEGTITFGPGKGHGWSNLTLRQMLDEMQTATDAQR